MGSKKNEKNSRNSHRHTYVKKKQPFKFKQSAQSSPPKGSRIINITKLQQFSNELTLHSSKCTGSIVLSGEQKFGLASILRGIVHAVTATSNLRQHSKLRDPEVILNGKVI